MTDQNSSNDWDPMTAASQSFMNSMSFRINDPGSMYAGSSISDVNYADIPCPFSRKPGKLCFKGLSCKYKHGEYTQKILDSHPKLAAASIQERRHVTMAISLPKKRIPSDGFISFAWVTTAIDPSEFYLVPKDSWNCLCKASHSEPVEDGHSKDQTVSCGFSVLDQLWSKMQSHFNTNRKQPNEYMAGELVAVRLELTTGKGWFRAVVIEDALEDGESDQAAMVKLKLLDFGLDITKSTLEVSPLPIDFAYCGPMAYTSQLFGISPLLGKWSQKATDLFKTFISGQVVIVEVKKTVYPDVDGIFNIFEDTPILVNLYVKLNGKFLNVAKEIGDQGLGIEWNPFPTRPFANQVLQKSSHEYAVREVKTDDEQEAFEEIFKKVMEREDSRMNRYVDRLKSQQGLDD